MQSVTIVIATFNAEKDIEKCLLGCFEQNYPSKKIVVIDGGSKDGTLGIIHKYLQKIHYHISEPDNGIYDAWNKAVRRLTTDWVAFLGSDDLWLDVNSLSNLMRPAQLYGVNFVSSRAKMIDVNISSKVGKSIGKPFSKSSLAWNMTVAHVGALHHISLFKKHGVFDARYRIAGDYDFLLRVRNDIRSEFFPNLSILMGGGGVSSTNLSLVRSEVIEIQKKHLYFGRFYAFVYSVRFMVRFKLINKFRWHFSFH